VDPNEKKEVGEGSDAESKRDEQHEHPDKYHAPGRSTRNLTDAEDKAARARVSNAEKVQCAHAELKEEHEEEDHEVEGRVVAEGLVRGPEPADERHGREEDEVEEPEAEGLTEVAAGEQIEQTDDHVRKEQADVRDPKVVEICDDFLELDGDVDIDVLVEAWLERAERRHWRPVVGTRIIRSIPQLLFSPLKVLCSSLQLLLAALEVGGGNLLLARSGVLRGSCVHDSSRVPRSIVCRCLRLVKGIVVIEVC